MTFNAIEREIDDHLAAAESAEDWQERIDARAAEIAQDEAKRRKAEEWTAGSFDGDHYTEVTLALHELHHNGWTLNVAAKLHALAKVESDALDAKLAEMAEEELADQVVQSARDAAEMRDASRMERAA